MKHYFLFHYISFTLLADKTEQSYKFDADCCANEGGCQYGHECNVPCKSPTLDHVTTTETDRSLKMPP